MNVCLHQQHGRCTTGGGVNAVIEAGTVHHITGGVLLIVVIGGMGTVYGSAIGAVLFLWAQSYLQDLLRLASEAASAWPLFAALLSPDRWLLWLGLLFVLSVYYFPTGIVGRLRSRIR